MRAVKTAVAVEDSVREKMALGFKVVRAQVAVPKAIGTYGVGGAKEAASATWGSGSGTATSPG
jgi:hypothetical protein